MENEATRPPGDRIVSIDALRGFDMFWITGGEGVAVTFAAWLQFPGYQALIEQFEHVPWEGFRFYDLIFPLFIFVVGVVLPISFAKHHAGQSKKELVWRIARRTVLLFLLGLLYSGALELNPQEFRLAGVLQRIAICYFFSALLVLFTPVFVQAAATVAIVVGYWWLFATVAAPGGTLGDYSMETSLAGYIDRMYLPGVLYYKFGDNEGILSTVPSIATCLIGVLCGHWLLSRYSGNRKTLGLLAVGAACLIAGYTWGQWVPIIKNLWTSPFVLVTGGWSMLLLALFYWVIDVQGFRRWAFFFIVIGVNAITIYLLSEIVDFGKIANFFFGGMIRFASEPSRPFLVAASIVAVEWILLYFLYRKRIFLRV
jgi:predicted acyltransferase